jgi:hypothetical protein
VIIIWWGRHTKMIVATNFCHWKSLASSYTVDLEEHEICSEVKLSGWWHLINEIYVRLLQINRTVWKCYNPSYTIVQGQGILLLEIFISMESTTFPEILEQPQKPRCRKGDMKQVSYLQLIYVKLHHTKFNWQGNHVPRICASLH